MRQATSRITPKSKKPTGDLLTWKTAAVAMAAIAALAILGRAHPAGTTQLTALATGALILCVDVVHGRRKAIVGTLGALVWVYQLLIVMPLGWGLLWPALGLVYATLAIGWKGTKRRRQAQARAGFDAIKNHLPPDAKLRGKPKLEGNRVKYLFKLPSGSPAWKRESVILNASADSGLPTSHFDIKDLSATVEGGLYEMSVRAGKPFDFPDPTYPEHSTWPKGKIPIGWDQDGGIVWLDMTGSRGKHAMICGRTGSGKTNTQRVMLAGLRHLKFQLWLIDPHNEFEPYHADAHDRLATSTTEGAKLLKQLEAEMRARLADKSLPRQPIICMVDETPAVLKAKGAEDTLNALAMEGRKVGIVLILAVQYPTVEQFGGPLRQQMSTVIAHRMKDTTGSLVALGPGSVKAGWDASNKTHMQKQGRAIAELDGADDVHQYVQVFPAPEAPTPPADTWQPPTAWAPPVHASVRPPSGGATQAEQPRTDERTDEPDDLDTAILKAISQAGQARPADILNAVTAGRTKVYERLAALKDAGLIEHDRAKGYRVREAVR